MVAAMSRGSSGSMTWCLVVALSLLLVARVQPYPGYGERLRSALRYQAQVQALGDRRTAAATTNSNNNNNNNNNYNQATTTTHDKDDYDGDDIEVNDYPRPYDYNDFLANRREPDIFPFDQTEASSKHLQQMLRSFRSVVGGTSPSDRVIPWTPELGGEGYSSAGGSRGVGGRLSPAGTSLAQLSFAENRQKRVMCHFKICNMGRRRRARHSSPIQGWLS